MTSVRTVRGKSYGAQPVPIERDVAEHMTIRLPAVLVDRIRERMRRQRMSRTAVIVMAIEKGLDL